MLYILIKIIIKVGGMKSYTDVQFTNMENNFLNASLSFPSTVTIAQVLSCNYLRLIKKNIFQICHYFVAYEKNGGN